ncbi:MAG: uroporphyrin-III C-methyltransferase / precorrin-2 dehydrogenase / sirohydrochlorin ferrochelatase [Nocardioidaceae bacterium]|jgi:uroporphyrin-III C-methyltransferase/precorrin-2 dehydrogenase/sirohydrochlorin ferrochelatase|nr:uroporphyrin-III C-methyltransferase / precorrin-2 dehydrogenase / sirohydrochlorin ferrochelatase [Nocardioidaceae bacterium]
MVDDPDTTLYPAGLKLSGRRVVVLGGGRVAQRRIPSLLDAGAVVHVISPAVTPVVEGYARTGEIIWVPRGYRPGDLEGAWYVVVATDDKVANEAASTEAEALRVFCVRSDDALAATAWTPAVGRHGSLTVAVLGGRDPRRSVSVRDSVMTRIRDGEIAAPKDRERRAGVVLVGAGPGDPDLITVAGRRALQEADVVVTDRLAPQRLLDELSPEVEVVDATKLPRGRAASQEALNELIVERALAGKSVVRLKGGDPFVFGRGFEEALACARAGVACRVVPGVTSATSVPGLAGVPVTHRGVAHDFVVASGHLAPGHPDSLVDWAALGRMRGTLVLLMAIENLEPIAASLVAGGRSPETAVAVVQDGSLASERRLFATLGTVSEALAENAVHPPAVVVVGEVVEVARRLAATS